MASTKNNFLNAKPVSKLGGKSGGVRKPSKPYAKPPAKPKSEKPARWDAKTKTERLQEAAKTKPKTPAPSPKPKPSGAVGARPMGTADVGPKGPVGNLGARTGMSPAKPTPKPAPKPAAKPTAAKPNSYTSGKPNPTAAVRGVKGGGPNGLTRNLKFGRGNVAAMLLEAANLADNARLTPTQRAKKNEVVNPDRGQNLLTKLQSGTLGKPNNPVKREPNGRSSTGVRVSDKTNQRDYKAAPTGSQEYNNYRNQQLAAERERLKGVGNAPKPSKPPASRPASTQPSRPAASRPSTPAAPAKSASPAAPKERRVSAATANRESGNYGTSRTNNPMIDDAMKARMRQREDATGVGPVKDGARYGADVKSNTQGVGPVKDGTRYASNLKPSTSTPGKKKEDETKTMSVAERMRRRRAGLA